MQVRIIRRVFVVSCLLVTILLIWAGVYARKQGLTNSWRKAIENDLAAQGYHVIIGKLTLGAFRGLVAEDVIIFRDAKRTEQIAFLDDVYLEVGLRRIFDKKISIRNLDVQKGKLIIPVKDRRVTITNLSGRVALTESLVEVVRVEAVLQGLRIFVKGAMVRHPNEPDHFDGAARDALTEKLGRFDHLSAIISALEHFEFERAGAGLSTIAGPSLEVEFRGDLANLGSTVATASLRSGPFRKKGGSAYKVQSLVCDAEFDGQTRHFAIPRLELLDDSGLIRASGSMELASKIFSFQAESNADLINIAEYFFSKPKLGEIVFFTPPTLTVEGEVDLNLVGKQLPGMLFPGRVLGEFQSERFVTSGVVFSGSRGGFNLDRDRFYIRTLRIDHKTGAAFLNAKFEPGQGRESLQFQTEVKMDPRVFAPLLKDAGAQDFLGRFHFNPRSGVYFVAAGKCSNLDFDDLQAKGVVDLRDFEWQGAPFDDLETNFEIDHGERWYRDLRLRRGEGRIEAGLAHTNTATRQWQIKDGFSNLGLDEGLAPFHPALRQSLKSIHFDPPPELRFSGKIDARPRVENNAAPRQTDFEVRFSSTGSARYAPNEQLMFLLNAPCGEAHFKEDRVSLRNFKAGWGGGSVTMEGSAPVFPAADPGAEGRGAFSGVKTASLAEILGFPVPGEGSLEGQFQLSSAGSGPRKLQGRGNLAVTGGTWWEWPAFQGLKNLLGGEVSAFAGPAKSSAAIFTLEEGVLKFNDLQLPWGSQPLRCTGAWNLLEGTVLLEVRPASGGPALFHAAGPAQAPQWKSGALPVPPSLSGR